MELTGKPTGWVNPSTAPNLALTSTASLRVVPGYTNAAVVDGACVDIPVPRGSICDGRIIDDAVRVVISEAVRRLVFAIPTPSIRCRSPQCCKTVKRARICQRRQFE